MPFSLRSRSAFSSAKTPGSRKETAAFFFFARRVTVDAFHMPSRPHLGLDLDGTLADHTAAKIAILNEMGFSLSPAETVSEALKDVLPPPMRETFQKRLYAPATANSAARMDGALEAFSALGEKGWRFSIVSRRNVNIRDGARAWIARMFPDIFPPERIFFVERDEEKNEVCEQEGIVAYVDDQIKVLEFLAAVPQKILFDPFERFGAELTPGILAFRAWKHFPALLASRAEESIPAFGID